MVKADLRCHHSAVPHRRMSEEIQGDCYVPAVDILKEGKLICHTEYSVYIPQAAAAVKRIVHADMVEVALNLCVQFV